MYKASSCLNCSYYAEIAELTEIEKNLTEEKRTKLHVNTKRPIHSHPDMFYTVTRFIDFDKYLFHKRGNKIFVPLPDIGVFVVSPEPEKNVIKIKNHVFKPSTLQCNVQFFANKKYLREI